MPSILASTDLEVRYGERAILDKATLAIDQGDRIGLVGRNGCGETTFLRILARLQAPDGGEVSARRCWNNPGEIRYTEVLPLIPAPLHYSTPDASLPRMEYATDAQSGNQRSRPLPCTTHFGAGKDRPPSIWARKIGGR